MKRTNAHNASLIIVGTILLSACGGGSSTAVLPPGPDASGLLKPVASAAELEASLKAGFTTLRESFASPEITTLLSGDTGGAAYTSTYTQERAVDEFDVVKYNGDQLYIAPSRNYFSCCFIELPSADVPVADRPQDSERSIRILQVDAISGSAQELTTIPLTETQSVQGMYLEGDNLVALKTENYFGGYGGDWLMTERWSNVVTGFDIYDVSNPGAPTLDTEIEIEGGFVDSRKIGNTIYIVTRHAFYVDGIELLIDSADAQATNQAILESLTLDDMLPKIRINGEVDILIDPVDCFIGNDDGVASSPVITSITVVPIDNPSAHRTVCYNEESNGVYMSEDSLYLTQPYYVPGDDFGQTRVHKFGLVDIGIDYNGSATIAGYVWVGGQLDFRLSEHDGNLRIFSTGYTGDSGDFFDHQLTILRESAADLALDVIAELPNAANPEEIGKANELLYGVRFSGARAYAVTFERIDPLYVFDLSKPSAPVISGSLEVTGFSDFLHPVSDDVLLGLGRSDVGGLKLELFNVADPDNPTSLGTEFIGGSGTFSEAQYDRHAFTYQEGSDGTDRFTVPADVYATDGGSTWERSGLFLYEIRDTDWPAMSSLAALGTITAERPGIDKLWPYTGVINRSVIDGETVLYIRDQSVWVSPWGMTDAQTGPF